jgi:hypothetical protein
VGTLRFAHPHMGPLESSILTGALGFILVAWRSGGARSHA